jgi:Tfp pilus assembly protein PilV
VTLKELKEKRAFPLIELLFALFLLAISLLALGGLIVTSKRNNSFGGYATQAATFTQDVIEKFRSASWASLLQ